MTRHFLAERACALAVLAAGAAACTDWDARGGEGLPVAIASGQRQSVRAPSGSDAGAASVDSFVQWDTWKPPTGVDVDVGAVDAGAADVVLDAVVLDAAPLDSGVFDSGVFDSGVFDSGVFDSGVFDSGVFDSGVFDSGDFDNASIDSGSIDSGSIDSGSIDSGSLDSAPLDTGIPDSGGFDAPPPDLGVSDVPKSDVAKPDVPAPDVPAGDGSPDWQGYDITFPSGADIFSGAIGDCLSMYQFQQEQCPNAPTAQCLNTVYGLGSAWAQAVYGPLKDCEQAVCVPKCAGATTNSCLESCVGTYCVNQFLGCISNAKSGAQSCAATMDCAVKYQNKLLSVGVFCFANAAPVAQKSVAAMIGCGNTKPKTESCIAEMAACYGGGAGSKNCAQTFQCATGCGGKGQTCTWGCLQQATPAALGLLDTFADCNETVCAPKCAGKGDACSNPCVVNECGSSFAACMSN
ncbi:MAG: hypothetical protein EXR79_10405 [Myxococcales bacterium]|nr:hypothetical protein [Myxococcales bacterium]